VPDIAGWVIEVTHKASRPASCIVAERQPIKEDLSSVRMYLFSSGGSTVFVISAQDTIKRGTSADQRKQVRERK
jgi:hypothetical protein